MFTPVIIGSSGWLASAAQWFFANHPRTTAQPVILGSREGWSGVSGARVYKLGGETWHEQLIGKRLVVFHLAYLTQEQSYLGQQDYIAAVDQINTQVVSLINKFDVNALIYASSGAAKSAFGQVEPNDFGKVIYGKLKARDETYFGRICEERDIRFLSPRIYSLAGKFINKPKAYAIADMIIQAELDRNIIVQAKHGVWRSYVDVVDLITVLWQTTVDSDSRKNYPAVFDVAHTVEVEMLDLARAVASHFNLPDSAIHRYPIDDTRSTDRYIGDRDVFLAMGNNCGVTFADLNSMVATTVEYMGSSGLISRG